MTQSPGAVFRLLLAGVVWLMLTSDPPPRDVLQQIRTLGELRIATINGPLTIYQTADGRAGFEYDLAEQFAAELGVRTRWQVLGTLDEAVEAVRLGNAHLLAAAWSRPVGDGEGLLTTRAYRHAQYLVAFHASRKPVPGSLPAIGETEIWFAQKALEPLLVALQPEVTPRLSEQSADILLERLAEEKVPAVAVDSDTLFISQRAFPELREGPALGEPLDKVWAVPAEGGESLLRETDLFLRLQEAEEHLATLMDRHFQHLDRLDDYSQRAFRERVENRLPKYRALFENAEKDYGLDWRFLAAVSYQESAWDAKAVSRTGVRGLMMLTRQTAKELGVKRRSDPAQSIDGGARYFLNLHSRVDESAPEPDRTWMTLAAYNLGFGHLKDLQRLTQSLGGEPTRWVDLREHILKLTQARWYRNPPVRYGYARGHEAKNYVGNIRAYYDLLRWLFPRAGEEALDVEQPLKSLVLELPAPPKELPEILIPAL